MSNHWRHESMHQMRSVSRGRGAFMAFDKLADLLRKNGFIDRATWDLDIEQVLAINDLIDDLDEHYGEDI